MYIPSRKLQGKSFLPGKCAVYKVKQRKYLEHHKKKDYCRNYDPFNVKIEFLFGAGAATAADFAMTHRPFKINLSFQRHSPRKSATLKIF